MVRPLRLSARVHRRSALAVLSGIPIWPTLAAGVAPAAGLTAGPAALRRLGERLSRLEEDGLVPASLGPEPGGPALYRAAAAALVDLLHGRVGELSGRSDVRRDRAAVPLAPWLAELAQSPDPAAVIDRASLRVPDAGALKAALATARAQAAAGGWPSVPGSGADTLEPGMLDPLRVPALRARLAATDPGAATLNRDDPLYDPPLEDAVRRFQEAEGLDADGRIGRGTLAALNRPPEALVRQLRVALDMRRAAAAPGSERRIEVNIAHQRLQVMEGGRTLADMAVIVGRPGRATPLLRVRLSAVQFNPPWGVPVRNAREDLLPRFRRDPRAMMEKGFRVYSYADGERVEVDPTGIDWRSINPERFPYVIRQDAGDGNALGRIKFIMPNSEDIYMHDTPDRGLFRRTERAFSSGCIRLERPMDLLEIVLEGTPGWDRARGQRAIDARGTSVITLGRSLPVRLHYTTVVVDGTRVAVRPDLYGLDAAYARALEAARPRPDLLATAG